MALWQLAQLLSRTDRTSLSKKRIATGEKNSPGGYWARAGTVARAMKPADGNARRRFGERITDPKVSQELTPRPCH